LLEGLPDKAVGKLIQEFDKGDEEQRQRGYEIFEALSRGEPERQLLDDYRNELTQQATTDQ
jgi:hypothetical protein